MMTTTAAAVPHFLFIAKRQKDKDRKCELSLIFPSASTSVWTACSLIPVREKTAGKVQAHARLGGHTTRWESTKNYSSPLSLKFCIDYWFLVRRENRSFREYFSHRVIFK